MNRDHSDPVSESPTFYNLFRLYHSHQLRISTNKDVEYGSPKGFITYTAVRNSQGPMEQAYYDGNPNNKLNFSEEVGGVQTATRQLDGFYTQKETYIANVIYAASEDIAFGPEHTLPFSIKFP